MLTLIKRFGLLIAVNILVMISVSILTGVICTFIYGNPTPPNGSFIPLILFAGLFGMGGSVVSLYISKWSAKRMMNLNMIDPNTATYQEREILNTVHKLARLANLPKMPEVGIFNSPEMNAFATGPSKSNSLVAVSSGLVQSLNKGELEAVLGHEIAHIANGDMVTLTLIQGVINTFVIFFSQIIANIVASQFDRNRRMIQWVVYMVTQIAFTMLGAIVVSYFSRIREFRADKGGAKFSSRENMIAALRALSRQSIPLQKEDQLAAFKISGTSKVWALFRTHPPLEDRIARLQKGY
jgi:heat shock protein HtpX